MIVSINGKQINTLETLNQFTPEQILQFVNSVFINEMSSTVWNNSALLHNSRRTLIKILINQDEAFFKAWRQDADKECFSDCMYPSKGESCGNAGKCKHSQIYYIEYGSLLTITDPFYQVITDEKSPAKLLTIKRTLTVQKFHRLYLKANSHKYCFYGPKDGMENLTFDQWMYADLAYVSYMKTGSTESLIDLCAALYDTKEGMKLSEREKIFKNLETSYQFAILLFYMSCRDFLAKIFTRVFKLPDDNDIKTTEEINSTWYDIKFHLARQNLFGDFNVVGTQQIANVMKHLSMIDKEREDREREMERRELLRKARN